MKHRSTSGLPEKASPQEPTPAKEPILKEQHLTFQENQRGTSFNDSVWPIPTGRNPNYG